MIRFRRAVIALAAVMALCFGTATTPASADTPPGHVTKHGYVGWAWNNAGAGRCYLGLELGINPYGRSYVETEGGGWCDTGDPYAYYTTYRYKLKLYFWNGYGGYDTLESGWVSAAWNNWGVQNYIFVGDSWYTATPWAACIEAQYYVYGAGWYVASHGSPSSGTSACLYWQMPELHLPAALAGDPTAYMPRLVTPHDCTGGCTTEDPILGRCTRAPHADFRHHTKWDGFEAAWTQKPGT